MTTAINPGKLSMTLFYYVGTSALCLPTSDPVGPGRQGVRLPMHLVMHDGWIRLPYSPAIVPEMRE
jgi:hypothetical protein